MRFGTHLGSKALAFADDVAWAPEWAGQRMYDVGRGGSPGLGSPELTVASV